MKVAHVNYIYILCHVFILCSMTRFQETGKGRVKHRDVSTLPTSNTCSYMYTGTFESPCI
jgi:hypothetical protein